MSLGHGASVVQDGLVLHLDAANQKSYPGRTGSELVTNSILTSLDGSVFNVYRDANGQAILSLCNVTSGKYYIVTYRISAYRGSVGATFRINNSGGNLSPVIGISSAGTFTRTFLANASGGLTVNGDNTGTDIDIDYVSVKEMVSNTGTSIFDLRQNYTGTLINGINYSVNDNGALVFDGVNDYIDLGSYNIQTLLNQVNPTEINISFSYRPYSTRNHGVFNLGPVLRVGQNSDGTLGGLLFYRDGAWRNAGGASYLLNANTTYYVSVSYNNRLVEVYVNGQFISSSSFDIDWLTTSTYKMNIGAYLDNPSAHGELYTMQIHDRALSASEVKQNFEALRGRYGI